MAVYPFEDVETGQEVLLEMPMSKAVSIGKVITRGPKGAKRRLRRLVSGETQIGVRFNGYFKNYQIKRGSALWRQADGYDER